MEHRSKKSNLLLQGSILAIAGLIVRLIGLLYRIPLINILTDEGSGYYASAYTVYSYLLILSSYGFPAAISRIVSAKLAKKKYREAHLIFKFSLVFSLIIGIVFTAILYFGAQMIANFIEIPNAAVALQGLAPALLIFSMLSVFRGYFQGMNTMVPTAISQIVEQVFNAVFSIVLAMLLLKHGFEYGAAGSSLGTAFGAMFGLIFIVFVYIASKPMISRRIERDQNPYVDHAVFYYWKLLLMTSIPMVIGTSTFHLTNLIDTIMFNKALAFHGYIPDQIAMLYGILEGKYKIIITLPVSIASAMATASIPSVTSSLVRGDSKLLAKKIDLSIRSVLMITFPSMIGIMIYAKPILELLFTNLDHLAMTTSILQIGSLSIVFFGVSTISIGLLQGLNRLNIPVKNALISLVTKVLFNIVLLYVFDLNLYGAVITNIIFAGVSAFLNFRAVRQEIPFRIDMYKTLIAPLMSSLIMGGVTLICYKLLTIKMLGEHALLIILPLAVLIYGVSILKLKAFNQKELEEIPFGNKFKRFL
ncbi:polysaccharide biosynthesis protein [Vallitaleaceae bacterium 9-2]